MRMTKTLVEIKQKRRDKNRGEIKEAEAAAGGAKEKKK